MNSKEERTHTKSSSIPTERAFFKRGTPTVNIHCTTLKRTKKEKDTPTQSQHKRERNMKEEIKREKSDNIMKTKKDVKRIKVRLYFVSKWRRGGGGIQKTKKES